MYYCRAILLAARSVLEPSHTISLEIRELLKSIEGADNLDIYTRETTILSRDSQIYIHEHHREKYAEERKRFLDSVSYKHTWGSNEVLVVDNVHVMHGPREVITNPRYYLRVYDL